MPRGPKTCVIIAFALRLLVLPALYMRLIFYNDSLQREDRTYGLARYALMTQVAMHGSIILTTLPCAKPFFVIFEGGVFRSPQDQHNLRHQRGRDVPLRLMTAKPPVASGDLEVGSPQPRDDIHSGSPDARKSIQQAAGIADVPTWDRRASFARPSMPRLSSSPERRGPVKRPSLKLLNPPSWKGKIMLAPRRNRVTPPPPPRAYSAYFQKPSSLSSIGSPRTPLSFQSRMKMAYWDRRVSHNSSQNSRESRRSSSAFWGHRLRPDEGETVTVISHDPEALARPNAVREESRNSYDDAPSEHSHGGIKQSKEVIVSYEDRAARGNRLQKRHSWTEW